jgi:A/G-specific adenine glycosylase
MEWFELQKRPLPWREAPTPYRVWVSEVMLQQTRASVVVSYFERWMQSFPHIESLAQAPLEQVIKMWEGLGYYSRARNLHQGAKQCVAQFGGQLPDNEKDLASIKGIGPYTLAALLNFAFRKRKPLIDGNVLRVLSRFFAIESSIDTPYTYALIETLIEEFLPKENFWVVSEALMELGALVCTKEAHCTLCPLQESCLAKRRGIEKLLPIRKPRVKALSLLRVVAIVTSGEKIALMKGDAGKIMADLYEFPYKECVSEEEGIESFKKETSWEHRGKLCTAKHHFTRYKASLFAHLFFTEKIDEEWIWVDKDRLLELPFSSGHRRILETYFENTTHRSLPRMGRSGNEDLE